MQGGPLRGLTGRMTGENLYTEGETAVSGGSKRTPTIRQIRVRDNVRDGGKHGPQRLAAGSRTKRWGTKMATPEDVSV